MTGGKKFAAAALLAALWLRGKQLETTRYTLERENLPPSFDGYRIAFLSDLHGASYGPDHRKLYDLVERADPDLVLLGGDLVNKSALEFSGVLPFLRRLSARFFCASVPGNHEQRLIPGKWEFLSRQMREMGIQLLENRRIFLEKGEERISLWGLVIPLEYYGPESSYLTPGAVGKLLGGEPGDGFQILLAHNPLYFPAYAKWGADLTLCGHVHGGVVRLPALGPLLSPERKFFPRYSQGMYEKDGKIMIVGRGLGDSLSGLRVNNPPEVPVIILKKKEPSAKE